MFPNAIEQDFSEPELDHVFDTACLDVFRHRVRPQTLTLSRQRWVTRFAAIYRQLLALPRHARRATQRQSNRSLPAVALMLALTPGASFAATINVATGVAPDIKADGKCSLIEAIFNANTDTLMHADCAKGSGTDTIVLPSKSKQVLKNSVGPLPGTSYYNQGLPKIRSAIVIEGRGSTIERADGSPIDLILAVETNASLTLNNTTISGRPAASTKTNNEVLCLLNRGRLTMNKSSILRGWNNFYFSNGGGALSNEGITVLNASTVANSESWYDGGAINNHANATLEVNDSIVSDNRVWFYRGDSGGGIYSAGKLTIRNSVIARNNGNTGNGGGVFSKGEMTIDGSFITDNISFFGGGVGNVGVATIRNSTISANRASGGAYVAKGGGIANFGAMTVAHSTVSGNHAYGYGGGIAANKGQLTLTHTTISNNRVSPSAYYDYYGYTAKGGGLFIGKLASTTRIERTILSGNTSFHTGPEAEREAGAAGAVVVNNFNLFGQSSKSGLVGFTPGPTDIVPSGAVASILMPIANNGGKGATHALAMTSPALNAAPVDALCGTRDQRGNPRPQGAKCDIGAFEGSAVLCNGLVTTMVGTVNADTLLGTSGRDIIAGLNGNDIIRGFDGDDVVCAGSGADTVYGGNGNDLLFGDADNDKLNGDAGNDALVGGTGTDKCVGGTNTAAGDTASQCETVTQVP